MIFFKDVTHLKIYKKYDNLNVTYEMCLIQNRKDEMKKKIEVLQHTLFFNFSPPT